MNCPVSEAETQMLSTLRKHGPATAGYLGSELWGSGADIRCENIRTTAWARPAGAVLHRLQAKGLVRRSYEQPRWLWSLTERDS